MSITLATLSHDQSQQDALQPLKANGQNKGYMGRMVQWIKADRPLILEIAVKCLAFVAAVFACLTIIGIPFVYLAIKEARKPSFELPFKPGQDNFPLPVELKTAPQAKVHQIAKVIGFDLFNALPILDLQGRMGATDYIDFLKEGDLAAPAMKGIDHYQRPFITFKVRDKQEHRQFVETIFQRHTDGSAWVNGGHQGSIFDYRFNIDKKDNLDLLANVLNGRDKRFVLIA